VVVEQKKRKPVFQEQGSAPPVKVEPPFKASEELEDIIGAEEPDMNDLPNGWKVLSRDQQSGKTYLVSSELDAEGVRAFWRPTRVLSHYKWVLQGRWSELLTRADIMPQPRYYKEIA
jgi:hypothetical protein